MLRRLLSLSVVIAVALGLLAAAPPAHAAPVSPKMRVFVDTWNESPTREYGTYVPITVQTEALNSFDGVPGSYAVTRNGVRISSGWSSRGAFAASLDREDPAGTYEFVFEFVPDDLDTYLAETKTLTLVRPKAAQSIDLRNPPATMSYGDSWSLTGPNPATTQLAVRAGSTPGACRVTGWRVDFTGAGTCTVDATAAESANHLAATPRSATFTVGALESSVSAHWSTGDIVPAGERTTLSINLYAGRGQVAGTAEIRLWGSLITTVDLAEGRGQWSTTFASAVGTQRYQVIARPTDPQIAPSTTEAEITVIRRPVWISPTPSPAYAGSVWTPTSSSGAPVFVSPTSGTTACRAVEDGTALALDLPGDCRVELWTHQSSSHEAAEETRTIQVVRTPTTTAIEYEPGAGPGGQDVVRVRVTAPGSTPAGNVLLDVGGTTTPLPLDGGVATWQRPPLLPGRSVAVTAEYTGTMQWAESSAQRTIALPKLTQTVSISAPPSTLRLGERWTPVITWDASGRPTSWSVTGGCERDGAEVRPTAVGDCTLTAVQAGDATYDEGRAERVVTVARALRTFSANPSPAYVGDTWSPTASGGGAVTAASLTSGVCTAAAGTVTFRAAGSCVVDLSTPADAQHDPATERRTVAVAAVPVTASAVGVADHLGTSTVTVRLTSARGTPTGLVDVTSVVGDRTGLRLVDGVVEFGFSGAWGAHDAFFVRVSYRPDDARWAPLSSVRIGGAMLEAQLISVAAPIDTARVGSTWTPAIAWYTSPNERSWAAAGACVREADAVRFTHPGDCTVTAVQAAGEDYGEGRAQRVVAVQKGLQAISLASSAPDTAHVGDAWTPGATGGASGRPVTIAAGPAGVCRPITGADDVATGVRFVGVGTCEVTLAQQGTSDYEAAERTLSVPVRLVPVTLSVDADEDLRVGAPGTIVVTATLPGGAPAAGRVSVAGGGLSLDGPRGVGTFELTPTFARAGTHTLTVAFEADDPDTHASPSTTTIVTVARGAQGITLAPEPPATALVGGTWRPTLTGGGSGQPVGLVASGACERTGTVVSFASAGTCTLTLDQPGTADWEPAPTVVRTTTVGLVPTSVRVEARPDARVGEPTALDVLSSASGTVEVVVDGQRLSGRGTVLSVTFERAGERTATVTFTPDDPATYQPFAAEVTLSVAKGRQQIGLDQAAPTARRAGSTWIPGASGGDSGAPVLVAAGPDDVCSATAGTVAFLAAGDCDVTLTQAGSDDYEAAPTLRRTVSVERRTPGLTLETAPGARVGEPVVVTARVDEAGAVRFALDGTTIGGPVPLTDGVATATVVPTAAGEREVTATFTPTVPGAVDGAEQAATLAVERAVTATAVAIGRDGLTATVTPTHPAAGSPTGEVVFAAAGRELGRAALDAGVASLDRPLPEDWAGDVTATYAGDAARAGSLGSVRRILPTITATVRAERPAVGGWYDAPVVVEFACTAGSAVVADCPAPVEVGEGADQAVTRSVIAADGGRASATAADLAVDATAPTVTVRGVREGALVKGRAGAVCRARDAGAGLASCRVTQRRDGARWVVTATATDRVGHVTSTDVRYRQARAWELFEAADEVGTVAAGRRAWLVVLTEGGRPVVTGPLGRASMLVRAGRFRGLDRWHVAVRFPADADRGTSYPVRVRGRGTDEVVRFRVG